MFAPRNSSPVHIYNSDEVAAYQVCWFCFDLSFILIDLGSYANEAFYALNAWIRNLGDEKLSVDRETGMILSNL